MTDLSTLSQKSLQRYKQICEIDLPEAVRESAMRALARHGERVMSLMKEAAPHDEVGLLRSTVKMEQQPELLRVVITAGGKTDHPVTHGKTGHYDYARAQEFGTVKMSSHPFFWPSYRLLKANGVRSVKTAVTRAMKREWHD